MDQTQAAPAAPLRRVFVSHSSQDAHAANALTDALEADAISCWIAPRDVAPGLRYGEALIGGINACSLFVLLLSKHSNASPQVLAEVERAVSKGLSVLTIRLEAVALNPSLEYFLSSFHWVDAFPLPVTPHLMRLVEAVRQSVGAPITLSAQALPSLPSRSPSAPLRETPTNLPHQLTSFVGRSKEIAEVADRLQSARLVTLVGSGGTGKTRLSLQAAMSVLSEFEDGVWFVELAPLSDPALVPQTVADVLGMGEASGTPLVKTLCAALKTKRMLLILDNCEHVLAACIALCTELLRSCSGIKIFASSREPLSIPGEIVYHVPPLSLPDASHATAAAIQDCEAVRLFTGRAQASQPDFALTDANAFAVAEVCRRLDGIPLALELAAARVKMLSIEDVNARLDNRFRLLTGGSKALLPRQQTLRALIDWSYDLLTDQEKALLCRLSVFAGGWTLAAAETVCAGKGIEDWEVLDLLTALVDKSLVVAAEAGGVGRYRLLETVRQYAAERLEQDGGPAKTRARHRDFFAALAEEAQAQFYGPEQALGLSRLETEYGNLREALAWCEAQMNQDPTPGHAQAWLSLYASLGFFLYARGYYGESRSQMERALTRTEGMGLSQARGSTLQWAGTLAWRQGDYETARTLVEASLTNAREAEDLKTIGYALNRLGTVAEAQGDTDAARVLYLESLSICRQIGDRWGIPAVLNNLGDLAFHTGDTGAARAYAEESVAVGQKNGSVGVVSFALNVLSQIALEEGDIRAARAYVAESLNFVRQAGVVKGLTIHCLNMLGSIVAAEGDVERAGRIWGAADTLFSAIGHCPIAPEREALAKSQAKARAEIGDEAFTAALAAGASLTLDAAMEEALG